MNPWLIALTMVTSLATAATAVAQDKPAPERQPTHNPQPRAIRMTDLLARNARVVGYWGGPALLLQEGATLYECTLEDRFPPVFYTPLVKTLKQFRQRQSIGCAPIAEPN